MWFVYGELMVSNFWNSCYIIVKGEVVVDLNISYYWFVILIFILLCVYGILCSLFLVLKVFLCRCNY